MLQKNPEIAYKPITKAWYLLEWSGVLLVETHILIVIFRFQCWDNQEQLTTTEIRDFFFF